MLAKLERTTEALDSFSEALKLDEKFYPALFGQTRLLVNTEQFADAKDSCKRLLAICNDEQKQLPEILALKSLCEQH